MILKISSRALLPLLLIAPLTAGAQALPLTDRTFFIEEAWRADSHVLQHAVAFEDGQWTYTWTQEWAAPASRHRLGYSLPVLLGDGAAALGTASVDYALQLTGRDPDRVALSPRASLLLSLSSVSGDRAPGPGFEIALPVTLSHGARLATHWNLRASRPSSGEPTEAALGVAVVRAVSERAIAVFESEFRASPLADEGGAELTVSAGLRWSFEPLASLGIVPGVAVPAVFGRDDSRVAVLVHMLFEHPFPGLD